MTRLCRASVAVVLLSGFMLSARAVDIEPLYDMYTDPDHAPGHPPTELWVADFAPMSNYQRIMMTFDLTAHMGQTADSAFLNLNRFFACPGDPRTNTNVHAITESWDESWSETVHVSHDNTPWVTYMFSTNGWHRIDVTSLVNEWLSSAMPNYGLVIQATSGYKFSKFYSREASSGVRPYLELFSAGGIEEAEAGRAAAPGIKVSPNPFRSTCRITVPTGALVEIAGRDGRIVYRAGSTGELVWRPSRQVSSGVYFVRATSEGQTAVNRLVYLD